MPSQPVQFGRYAPAQRVIVHLSDTHLLAGNRLLGGRYDTAANLAATLAAVERTGVRPDAIVFTGDLTDLGEPEAYAALRAEVEPFAARLGAPIVWVAGNHDERPALREGLFDAAPTHEPVTAVHDLGGLRLIALDSTVPGWHHGDLDDAQLAWLRDTLAEPAPLGTILAMHHPPVPSVLPLAASVELRDQSRLARVLRGTDVRAIIAGHLHYSTFATFAGIPVSVASSTCYAQDLTVPVGGTRPQDGAQAFNMVHVYDDTVVHSVVPVDAPRTLEYIDAADAQRRLAEAGVQQLSATPRITQRRIAPPTEPIPVLR